MDQGAAATLAITRRQIEYIDGQTLSALPEGKAGYLPAGIHAKEPAIVGFPVEFRFLFSLVYYFVQ
jgi:hypothetical protein